jgi:cold shock CspA family protein/ribosome-associated translation inhibitor RaiA
MNVPLQIAAPHVALSEADESTIREASAKLERFWDRITSCRVEIDMPRRRGRTGLLYNVRIDLGVPGGEIVIKRQPQDSLLEAVQDAFKAAERRVRDQARKMRGDIKLDRASPRGTVTQLLPWQGYGFITTPEAREVYFNRSSVLDGAFDRLKEGTDVRFAEEPGEHGPQATAVAITRRRRGGHREPAT